jgi:IS1 family transposase
MLFIHLWSKGYTEQLICDDFSFSKVTVVDWSRFCRDLCVYYFETSGQQIGGPGTIVEIDETLVVKRKYERGRVLSEGWLFGGIERRADGVFNCFMRVVYNRSEPHLTHLIRQHVAPGTLIMTDGWAAYSNLDSMGYLHQVVVHEDNFVSPIDSNIHTQTIEATWYSLKRFIRARGTHKGSHLFEYICEWIFRRKFPDVFESLLDVIRSKYNE